MSASRWAREACVRSCLLSVPLMCFMAFFTIAPLIEVVRASVASEGSVFSLTHFSALFHHHNFTRALTNTVVISCVSLVVQCVCGVACALFIHHVRWGRGAMLALFLLPLGVPTIVNSSIMRYVFDFYGYLNQVCVVWHLSPIRIDWLAGDWVSYVVVISADAWKVLPFMVLIILAGRKTIDTSLYEAARIDGASSWMQFVNITLPLLLPFIMMAIVVRGIDVFRLFELPLALFGASFPLLSTYAYFEYAEYNNPHAAAAASVVLIVLIMCFLCVMKCVERMVQGDDAISTR